MTKGEIDIHPVEKKEGKARRCMNQRHERGLLQSGVKSSGEPKNRHRCVSDIPGPHQNILVDLSLHFKSVCVLILGEKFNLITAELLDCT